MCSRILKQDRALKYLIAHAPVVLYLGFTSEEWRRAQRTTARYEELALRKKVDIQVQYPLIEQGITKAECAHRVETCWGIKKPQMYEWADHANCIPCVKGKKAYWGLIHIFEREAWERASQAEKDSGCTIFTEAGSLEEELENCLRLAKKHLEKREGRESLLDFPCECAS
jgi:hypothetical protein